MYMRNVRMNETPMTNDNNHEINDQFNNETFPSKIKHRTYKYRYENICVVVESQNYT